MHNSKKDSFILGATYGSIGILSTAAGVGVADMANLLGPSARPLFVSVAAGGLSVAAACISAACMPAEQQDPPHRREPLRIHTPSFAKGLVASLSFAAAVGTAVYPVVDSIKPHSEPDPASQAEPQASHNQIPVQPPAPTA